MLAIWQIFFREICVAQSVGGDCHRPLQIVNQLPIPRLSTKCIAKYIAIRNNLINIIGKSVPYGFFICDFDFDKMMDKKGLSPPPPHARILLGMHRSVARRIPQSTFRIS